DILVLLGRDVDDGRLGRVILRVVRGLRCVAGERAHGGGEDLLAPDGLGAGAVVAGHAPAGEHVRLRPGCGLAHRSPFLSETPKWRSIFFASLSTVRWSLGVDEMFTEDPSCETRRWPDCATSTEHPRSTRS